MNASESGPVQGGPAWERLEDQLGWYERKSADNKRAFMYMKIIELVAAATIPVSSGVTAPIWVTGGLGAVVVVLEGIQQLGQYQANWIGYRSTAEALKHEKYLYLSAAGPYSRSGNQPRMLAERIEGLISQEHAKWTAGRDEETKERSKPGA